ncbi:MAG: prepilin-type N-terminal cleavage/methylation domain-containing protein [Planctomycetaceae bacterium]|nr:prepilin-type N-terminal cleavage/methylation domain-containing protein [Planctomycetaceae bacterium]
MQDSQSAVSRQPSAVSRRAHRLSPLASDLRPLASRRSAFTLTELLIVIAIIGILAGLIAAAAVNALRASRRSQTLLEIRNISGAMENFKNDYGAYPPNGMNPTPQNPPAANSMAKLVQGDFQRMFAKAFQGNSEPPVLALALCGQNTSGGSNQNVPNGMAAAEALYFWLGGFSSDKKFPISGPGGPSFPVDGPNGGVEVLESRTGGYEFDRGRLRTGVDEKIESGNAFKGRYLLYSVDLNQNGTIDSNAGENRRINLWQYNPKGSEQPLVYFDTSRHKPYQYDAYASPTATNIFALKKVREGLATPSTMKDIAFVDNKFQIVHPGLDDDWGNFGSSAFGATDPTTLLLFPTGPFIGPIADTLTNFTDGTLADASEQ